MEEAQHWSCPSGTRWSRASAAWLIGLPQLSVAVCTDIEDGKRCCIIFGWLICRGPRTFRAFAYYLHRYWICVRQALGTPVSSPPTAEERQDFQTLVQALAGAYRPYLTDQLASVEFPSGIPDE